MVGNNHLGLQKRNRDEIQRVYGETRKEMITQEGITGKKIQGQNLGKYQHLTGRKRTQS